MAYGYYEIRAYNASTVNYGIYSPVTLNHQWPKLERLLFVLLSSLFSCTMNGFFVAAFFVENALKRIGNVFLACVGLADLFITTGVMPISAVVLLSGEWDVLPVCKLLHFLTLASTYSYSVFFMFVAGEGYYRICRTSAEYDIIVSMRIGCISIIIFCITTLMAAVGVYMGFDYDYCERKHYGNFYFKIVTIVIFHVIPCIFTIFGLIFSMVTVRKKIRAQPHYKRSSVYDRDFAISALHLSTYLLYVVAWTPYLIIVHEYPTTDDTNFYNCAWVGISRSVITSFLYSVANKSFRRAFGHLINYCFCKNTLSGSFASRHRRDCYRPSSDVSVHIMHRAVKSNSPHSPRPGCSTQETQEL